MPVHLLCGDTFLVSQELRKLESSVGDLLDANRHRLVGGNLSPGQLFEVCAAAPFLDTARLVVVEGLLATAEGSRQGRRTRRPTGQRRTRASAAGNTQAQSSDPRDQLEQAVTGIPETTLLIFVDGPVSESNSILQTLKPLAQVQNLQAPAGESLARWIKTAAQEKGASLSPPAIANLVDQVGNDLRTLDQELEKLALYCWGRTVEESDVTALVSHAREANIFAAVDAMVEGRQGQALQLLHQLKQDGRDPSYIIAMVERQLRLLALARDAIDQRLDQRALGEQLGSASQFVIRKTMDQARKHTWNDITWRYQQLLETDLSIKQGRLDPDVALAMLVAGPPAQV